MTHLRRYPFTNAYNIRDLGGYPTLDGKITQFGVFFRADSLAALSADEWLKLASMNVKTIIDLRSTREKLAKPYEAPPSICCLHMPLQNETQGTDLIEEVLHHTAANKAFNMSMSEEYVNMLNNNINTIASTLKTLIAASERGAVLFHCTAGKDRTGILAALILFLCNVDAVDISADYQITYTYNLKNPILCEAISKYGALLRSDPDHIEALVGHFYRSNIKSLFLEKILTESEITLLKNQFLCPIREENI